MFLLLSVLSQGGYSASVARWTTPEDLTPLGSRSCSALDEDADADVLLLELLPPELEQAVSASTTLTVAATAATVPRSALGAIRVIPFSVDSDR